MKYRKAIPESLSYYPVFLGRLPEIMIRQAAAKSGNG